MSRSSKILLDRLGLQQQRKQIVKNISQITETLKEAEKETKTTLSPFEQEKQALDFFEKSFPTNNKKLNKLALKVYNDYPPFIQKGLLYNILVSKDPVKYLLTCFKHRDEFPEIIKGLVENKKHGMIIHKKIIYELEIKACENWLNSNDPWGYEEELDIQDKLINAWLDEQKLTTVSDAKIVLFREFGFSGMPRGFSFNV